MADYSLEKSLQSVTTVRHSLTLFSSVGGAFSAPDAHSLQDLIRVVQPLRLQIYKSSDLHAPVRVGEGGSYRVFRCDYQKANAVAVKQVKLPLERSEPDEFRRRVGCIKKDLEIMHHRPLANHPNIARLLGYGWGLLNDSALPFLVTEFAHDGNLRQYLQAKTSNVSLISRMKLMGQIATGLHALHLCGVAHGDLKLENVLIVRLPMEKCNSEGFVAQLSDFGQSCLLSSEQTRGSAQSYCGTRGYIAPELFQDGKEPIDFIKCDIWALALLVWEILIGGSRYFDNQEVMSLIQERVPVSSNLPSADTDDSEPGSESSHRPGYDIFTISDILFQLACKTVDFQFKQSNLRIDPMSQFMVTQIFRFSLQVNPSKRCGDVSRLPFTYSMHKPSNIAEMTKQPIVKTGANNVWDFEMFRPENVVALPHTIKLQILSDLKSAAASNSTGPPSYGDPILCLAMAYATGYGVHPDHSEFCKYTRKSAENGSVVASLILASLDNVDKSGHILQAFSHIHMNGSQNANQGMCEFISQTSESVDLASLNSSDGCNRLHYLSLVNMPDYSPRTAIKRHMFGPLSEIESQSRLERLRRVIHWMKLSQPLNGCTSAVHYVHPHFPLCLEGTPLSFAIHLGCHESVNAFLLEGAYPLDPLMRLLSEDRTTSTLQPKLALTSALHTAVACHRPRMFEALWSTLTSSDHKSRSTSNGGDLHDLLIKRNWIGASIICALAHQSQLERILLHGSKSQEAQTDMIHTLLGAFGQAAKSMSMKKRLSDVSELVTKGVQGILALGDLDIAIEVMAALSRDGPCSYHDIPNDVEVRLRSDIVDDALRIACSDSFDPARSAKYLQFARDIGMGIIVDARAIKMMMEWKAEEVFRVCLNDGLNLQSVDEEGRSPLHHAIMSGFWEQYPIAELLTRRIGVDAVDHAGNTPLHLATSLGFPRAVRQLLANNAAPMAIDGQGYSVLHRAVMSRKLEVVKDIIDALESRSLHGPLSQTEKHVDVDYGNASGKIPLDGRSTLHLAVEGENIDVVKLLLDKGVDVNSADAEGKVALHYAIQIDSYDQSVCFCNALMSAGAWPLIPDKRGKLPLHEAALRSHADPSATILTCFADCHPSIFAARGFSGQNILHQAVECAAVNSVAKILKLGASPHSHNSLGQNTLHTCAQKIVRGLRQDLSVEEQSLMDIVDILLNVDVDLFEQDYKRHTPMEYAAISGHEVLLCHFARHVRRSPTIGSNLKVESAYQRILSSVWALAVSHEQWTVLGCMFTIDPSFEPDMSLLDRSLYQKLIKVLNNLERKDSPTQPSDWKSWKTAVIDLVGGSSEDGPRAFWNHRNKHGWQRLIYEYNRLRAGTLEKPQLVPWAQ